MALVRVTTWNLLWMHYTVKSFRITAKTCSCTRVLGLRMHSCIDEDSKTTTDCDSECTPRGGGTLPSNGLLGMYRWMGSHFHDATDYNGVAFSSIFNSMGSHFLGTLRVRKSFAQK